MPNLTLIKNIGGFLSPGDQATADFVFHLKTGQAIHGDFKKVRNYQLLKKFFVLLNFLYEHWEPGIFQDPKWKGLKPQKSFLRFRKDIIVLAGFFDATYRINGSVRIEAKSISFSNMSEEEFEELYSRVIDVGLKHILPNYKKTELEKVVDELLAFS